jgi:hypothetical protein
MNEFEECSVIMLQENMTIDDAPRFVMCVQQCMLVRMHYDCGWEL